MPYDPAELDAKIILAISEFDGVPGARSLARLCGVVHPTVLKRIEANPKINQRMEERGREWLDGLGEEEFLGMCSSAGWTTNLPEYARGQANERLDCILLREIEKLNEVPSAEALKRAVKLGRGQILSRITANPKINERMEERGREWLDGLGEREFLKTYSEKGWVGGLPGYARKIVDVKLDGILIREINKFEGVPSANALGEKIGVSSDMATSRIEANPKINERMETRGEEWLDGLGEREFLKIYSSGGWVGSLPGYAKMIVNVKLDGILLREINKFEGVPSANALGEKIGVSNITISSRIEANPKINERMEERGAEWLDGLGEREFLKTYSEKGWVGGLPGYARKIVDVKLDGILLREINKFERVPSFKALGRKIGFADGTVTRRIEANETLWEAYYLKRGLTPDQAVELALERNDESKAFEKALNERLRGLSAFREMIGLLRCFGDLMEKTVSCVSLYPEPLAKAAEELGMKLKAAHVPMKPFRKAEEAEIPGCGTVVVHGLHRLPEEGLNLLFGKIRELYDEHPELSIITTYSIDYSAGEGFLSALENNGFRLEESGVIRIGPPGREVLEGYGVPSEDLGRLERKVSGEFNVIVLGLEDGRAAGRIPCLGKAPSGDGKAVFMPEAEPMEMPEGMGKELTAKLFSSSVVVAPAPFVVEVMDGKRRCAVVGFDMDPIRKNAVEVVVEKGAPFADYRKMARRLAADVSYRRNAGVVPNRDNRAQISKLERGAATRM